MYTRQPQFNVFMLSLFRLVVLKLQYASESPGSFVEIQKLVDSGVQLREFLIKYVWGGA